MYHEGVMAPSCILFGWRSNTWKLWVVQLANIVLPMRLQSPSAPKVFLLPLPWGPWAPSDGWLYLHLNWSGTCTTSQGTANTELLSVSSYCRQQ